MSVSYQKYSQTAFERKHTIINIIISPIISRLDLLLQITRQQINLCILLGKQMIKFVVKHSNDLARLVTDNLLLLLVVERRHCEAAFVVRLDVEVDVSQMREPFVQWVGGCVLAGLVLVFGLKAPACREVSMRLMVYVEGSGPFSSICQCTLVNGKISSIPFNFRTMSARWAHGQAYETSAIHRSSAFPHRVEHIYTYLNTYKDDTYPSPQEIPPPSRLRSSSGTAKPSD